MQDKIYEQIKTKIIDTETTIIVKDYSKNRVILDNYYDIGRLLVEAQGGESRAKYGNEILKKYAKKLENDIGKKYDTRLLRRIRQFYILFKNKKWSTMSTKLSWSHYVELLSLEDENEIKYYINVSINQNLTIRQLREKIKSNEYKNLSIETKEKLINNEKLELIETVKDPILIKNPNNKEVIYEKTLQKLILEDIESFMKELGNSFSFVGSEYKIKIGNEYNYIDLLLFNYEYNCFVVVELKVTELKKEHLGQIQVYMNYIDNNLKKETQDKTIGIIVCKKDNKYVIRYCSDKRIISREYLLN